MSSRLSDLVRVPVELLLAAMAGTLALAFPVLTGQADTGHSAAFFPFMADVVEGVELSSITLLFGVGVAAGLFGRASGVILGMATAALLPMWSAADMVLGGTGHNLFPFEWFIYGIYGLIGIAGALVGRGIQRKRRASAPSGTTPDNKMQQTRHG
jgi:hypothetical protein